MAESFSWDKKTELLLKKPDIFMMREQYLFLTWDPWMVSFIEDEIKTTL